MPTPLLKSFSDKTGKPMAELEKAWKRAKEIALETYPETHKYYWGLVVTILKNKLGIKENMSEELVRMIIAAEPEDMEKIAPKILKLLDKEGINPVII